MTPASAPTGQSNALRPPCPPRPPRPPHPPIPGKSLDRFLRLSDVAQIVGLGRTTVYRYIKSHGFPAPIPLGGKRVAWLESEVRTWMQARIQARSPQA